MSDNSNIIITLSSESLDSSTRTGLMLEQGPWGENKTTTLGLVETLAHNLYGRQIRHSNENTPCDPPYDVAVYVYMFTQGMNYHIGITHGTLGECIIDEVEIKELLNVKLDNKINTKYPFVGVRSAEWIGQVYNDKGGPVTDISIITGDNELIFNSKVYGSIRVIYSVIRHKYRLTLPARSEAEYSKYDSVVWANWNGGVELLPVDFPLCVDNFDDIESNPSIQTYLEVTESTSAPIMPEAEKDSETVVVDYCSQKRHDTGKLVFNSEGLEGIYG